MQKWSWASLTVDFSLTSDKTTEKNKERLTITDEAQQPPTQCLFNAGARCPHYFRFIYLHCVVGQVTTGRA